MIKIMIALVAVAVLAGCISQNPYIEVKYYSVDGPSLASVEKSPIMFDTGLAVVDLQAASRYDLKMLHYRQTDGVIGFREYDRWVEQPSEMLTRALVRAFQNKKIFRYVGGSRAVREAEYALSGYIVAFDENIDGETRTAMVSICFELNRVEGGEVLWSGVVSKQCEIADNSGSAFAAAMRKAANDLIGATLAEVSDAVESDESDKKKSTE